MKTIVATKTMLPFLCSNNKHLASQWPLTQVAVVSPESAFSSQTRAQELSPETRYQGNNITLI
jgi:hypothetical protein